MEVDMFQFIKKGMRGGICYITNRNGEANNECIKSYDETKPPKYIMYLDANKVYGWAMSRYLPTGRFKWMKREKIDKIDLGKHNEKSKKGLVLEVDLEYPKQLHDDLNDYPLCAEQIPTLSKKERYVLHYTNLQQHTDLGLKVKKVHRVLEFSQSSWLKRYIDFNTQRTQAVNSFEKD